MRNYRSWVLAVFCALATLVVFVARPGEKSIFSALISSDKSPSQPQAPPSAPRTYSWTTQNIKHSGYSKVVYAKSEQKDVEKGSVLITSSINNEKSFGGRRSFKDFFEVIDSLEYPKNLVSLSFYCGSQELLKIVTGFLEEELNNSGFSYSRVTVLYAPFLQSKFKASDHKPAVQRLRRRSIARGRNFVLLNSLEAEEFTLFLDADIIRFDHTDILHRFVQSEKDIIVPRVERGGHQDYDRNSWRGHRKTPTDSQLKLMDEDKWDEANYVPEDIENEIFHLEHHAKEVQELPESDPKRDPSYTVELDSVGGAVLFAKSIIYKQGIVFPTLNIVGTSWNRKEGFDGIETEGLCYMARAIGYECHAMPNLVAQHFDR